MEWLAGLLGGAGAAALAGAWWLQRRGLDPRWVVPAVRAGLSKATVPPGDFHVFLCITDHFEPKYRRPASRVARARVQKWVTEYPKRFRRFRDCDGRTPRHSFFYPMEEYEAEYLDALAEHCRRGFGEVEVHLHHDGESSEQLRAMLEDFKHLLAEQHGLLSSRRSTGELAYGFIHGNWALCNSRNDGRWCGVNNELDILRETGCYADFTMPSAPHETQVPMINAIYRAANRPGRSRSHASGVRVGTGPAPANSLMLIQGPLVAHWRETKRRFLPKFENGCIQASQPATLTRLEDWLKARVQVPNRPDWFFVKLHCHGAPEDAHDVLLGEPMIRFHDSLAQFAQRNPCFKYHYVSAREMYNLARAAEDGFAGAPIDALDYELTWNSDGEALMHQPLPIRTRALTTEVAETAEEREARRKAAPGEGDAAPRSR